MYSCLREGSQTAFQSLFSLSLSLTHSYRRAGQRSPRNGLRRLRKVTVCALSLVTIYGYVTYLSWARQMWRRRRSRDFLVATADISMFQEHHETAQLYWKAPFFFFFSLFADLIIPTVRSGVPFAFWHGTE